MEIERAWGHDDGWFATLTRERQLRLLAWYRVLNDPQGKRLAAKKAKGKKFWGV